MNDSNMQLLQGTEKVTSLYVFKHRLLTNQNIGYTKLLISHCNTVCCLGSEASFSWKIWSIRTGGWIWIIVQAEIHHSFCGKKGSRFIVTCYKGSDVSVVKITGNISNTEIREKERFYLFPQPNDYHPQ